jgi:DNA-binding transcriptional regulator YbjK
VTVRRVPNDPGRRERIVAAAAELMSRDGLHTLTHRRIADQAGVPLGSTTYYFRDLDELVLAATRLALADGRERIRAWSEQLGPDADPARVCNALAAMTVGYVGEHRERTVLDYELYVAGLRRGGALSEEWIDQLRAELRSRFDPLTADALTAAVDGLTLQALLAARPPTVEQVGAVLRRVAGI